MIEIKTYAPFLENDPHSVNEFTNLQIGHRKAEFTVCLFSLLKDPSDNTWNNTNRRIAFLS